jgi:predicted ATPase
MRFIIALCKSLTGLPAAETVFKIMPMFHLSSIAVRKWPSALKREFPFNLALVQALKKIEFTSPVTFFVGENGSGKSTILEAIACAAGSIAVGSENIKTDKTLGAVRKLAQQFKLTWQQRTHKGFFLRAEDFFGYAKRLAQMRVEMEEEMKAVDKEYQGRSETAKGLAKMAYSRELHDMRSRYGEGLDTYSHGESFLTLFQSRFVPNGLYLLDEPEAPLSPIRQLSFIAAVKGMVEQNAQFIIATHSPIIMAFPNATILSFDSARIRAVKYEELEHVTLTRSFLNNPEAYLKHL